MAGKKEFEMLFALNARMNGGFGATFSKAQAEFTRLGKEIQSLHRVQGDIASYQKQQSAIENTRTKLESLQRQHDLLQKEIGETTGSTAGLEREKVKLEERIKSTEAALERQNQKLEATGTRLKDAGVNTGNLAQKDAELTTRIKELETAQDNAASGAASFGEKSAQAFGTVQNAIAAAGVTTTLKEIADAYLECVGVAGDFEETMSNVEALSGANTQEMAALSAQAKELGATTKFTAQEAGGAMGYMAMAGWDATDMLGGMNGVLQLAAASGEDLAQVSDIVTDALTAFGLQTSDSGRFADILAVAATKANTNVSMMGDTFKYVAPVAGSLGYTAEDTALQIALMANSGIKASQAGTSLRSIITRLSTDAGASSTQLGALGILTKELGVAFYNTDGSARALNDVIADSREAWAGLSKEQQVNYAKTIAGQEAISGWLALMNAGGADVEKLSGSINNCTGAAQRMANIKLDNLNGQLTLMDSAWEALKVTIGEQFNPELRGLAEISTDILGGVNEFIQEHPALVKGLMAGAGAVGAGVVALTGVATVTKVLIPLMGALTAATPGVNVIMGVTAAVAGGVGVVTALATAADAGVPSVKELTEAARDMREAMDEASVSYEETATRTMATAEVAGIYIGKLEEIEAATGGNVAESQEYHNILALLTRTVPELADYINLESNAIEGGTEALRQHTEAWKKDAETQAYQDYINSLYDQYGEVMAESAENSIKLTQAQIRLETAEKSHTAALERMGELERQAAEGSGVLDREYFALQDSLQGYIREMESAQKEIGTLTKARDKDAEAVAAAEAEIESAQEVVESLTGATQDQTDADSAAARQTEVLQGSINTTMEAVQGLTEAYYEAYGAALESIGGQYELWDQAAQVAETSVGDINAALESQAKYWQDYNANLQSLSDRAKDIEGLSTVIASFADGSAESVNAVAGMASASDEDLRAMVTNWQTLQREQGAAAQSLADMQTDMSAVMDEWGQSLAEDIEDMNLSDEAKKAGRATIRGYVDAANEMLPQVQAAYESLSKAAVAAIGRTYYERKADRIRNESESLEARGFASGTSSAPPGWAWVGEKGPELMFFNGGEKVLNATQTSALQARAEPAVSAMLSPTAGSAPPPVNVTFQIQGDATPEVIQDLRGFADEIVSEVLDALDEAGEDTRRRTY